MCTLQTEKKLKMCKILGFRTGFFADAHLKYEITFFSNA